MSSSNTPKFLYSTDFLLNLDNLQAQLDSERSHQSTESQSSPMFTTSSGSAWSLVGQVGSPVPMTPQDDGIVVGSKVMDVVGPRYTVQLPQDKPAFKLTEGQKDVAYALLTGVVFGLLACATFLALTLTV